MDGTARRGVRLQQGGFLPPQDCHGKPPLEYGGERGGCGLEGRDGICSGGPPPARPFDGSLRLGGSNSTLGERPLSRGWIHASAQPALGFGDEGGGKGWCHGGQVEGWTGLRLEGEGTRPRQFLRPYDSAQDGNSLPLGMDSGVGTRGQE